MPPISVVKMFPPGATKSTNGPVFDHEYTLSFGSVAPISRMLGSSPLARGRALSPAGAMTTEEHGVLVPTITHPLLPWAVNAARETVVPPVTWKPRLITRAPWVAAQLIPVAMSD